VKSPNSIDDRLRAALSGSHRARPEGVDMSAAAVTDRIKDLAEMSSLCLELARVRQVQE
jgi:hypothetical protein